MLIASDVTERLRSKELWLPCYTVKEASQYLDLRAPCATAVNLEIPNRFPVGIVVAFMIENFC